MIKVKCNRVNNFSSGLLGHTYSSSRDEEWVNSTVVLSQCYPFQMAFMLSAIAQRC